MPACRPIMVDNFYIGKYVLFTISSRSPKFYENWCKMYPVKRLGQSS